MEELVSTQKAWVKYEEKEIGHGSFRIGPLKKGFGLTIGNSLRRILMSEMPGFAVTGIEIEGVNHEFTTIPHVVDDVLQIITNCKRLIVSGDANVKASKFTIKADKVGKYYAKDIIVEDNLKVINSDQYLFEVTKGGSVNLTMYIEQGIGYRPSFLSSNSDDSQNIHLIKLDASFSPVINVDHKIDNLSLGKDESYDILTLDVKTNKTKPCDELVLHSVETLKESLLIFDSINEVPEDDLEVNELNDNANFQKVLDMSIEDLELSARSSNCLRRAGIDTINELVNKDYAELIQIKNFGKKSATEINAKLKIYNLSLKED